MMNELQTLIGCLAVLGAASAGVVDDPRPTAVPPQSANRLVQPRRVRKLVADGRHNAFTSLARWQNGFFLSYRSGLAHNSTNADCIVLQSPDGEHWQQTLRVDIAPDDRGGHLLATPQRLFLYLNAMQGAALRSHVLYTDDGQQWTKPAPLLEPQWIFWQPLEHNGRFYANAHLKAEGKDAAQKRASKLITSADGLKWETVATVRKGNYESETTFFFGPNDHLFAFLRQKYSGPGFILESDPPYQQWTQRPAGVHFSGHCIRTLRGVNYLISRTSQPKKATGTMIYTFAEGNLTPYCELPAGGDCSYAAPVEAGDDMLVSYYSSHEGTTSIYLARVPLLGTVK
jgi:hypothetical protein